MFEALKEAARRRGIRQFWRRPPPPSNWRPLDASGAAIERDVAYALSVGLAYRGWLAEAGRSVRGAFVLEIGPGPAYGSALVLAAFGARVAVLDRWLSGWQPEYHGAYYRRLASALETVSGADPCACADLAQAGRYDDEIVLRLERPAETLGSSGHQFDAIVSNAVLEHVVDIDATAKGLWAATAPGGAGFHQIDFRDHRGFDTPLDHLLFSRARWNALTAAVHMEYGTQRRPHEYEDAFRGAGFELDSYRSTDSARTDYVEQLVARLRRTPQSPFRLAEARSLVDLGGLFVVSRPAV